MTRRGFSLPAGYSMPGRAGIDDLRGKQEPRVEPVDDLSRFVLDRIREAETEPLVDRVAEALDEQPMAYRYAMKVREDCKAFRQIVAAYCRATAGGRSSDPIAMLAGGDDVDGLQVAMLAIAHRWSDHPNFDPNWRR